MSWLARSIANSLRIHDDDSDADDYNFKPPSPPPHHPPEDTLRPVIEGDLRGVRDDLSEFKDSFTRQLLGVANFLAPPPPPTPPTSSSSSQPHFERVVSEPTRSEPADPSISGGGDEDESPVIGRVPEVKDGNCDERIDSCYELGVESLDEDEDDYINAVGLTDEVLTFAGNIAHHPETWLDFPVEDDEDMKEFPMSESQKRHAQAVERLTPRLAALRIELCPAHMSVGFFWKVYFVLLHSRLNKQDAALLSTPEVVEARAKWMQEQQIRAKKESEWFHSGLYSRASDEDCTPRSQQNDHSETLSSWTFASEPATSSTTVDSDMEKHVSADSQLMGKSIVDEKSFEETDDKHLFLAPISKRLILRFVDNDDDDESDEWPEDDCLDQSRTLIPVGIEDEVSFSDLEDDDCYIPVISRP